ncbi:g1742 [Coccomyxa elongata]
MTCSGIFAHINVGRCSNIKSHSKEKGAPLRRWLPSQSKAVTELDCHSRGSSRELCIRSKRQQQVVCMAHPRRVARVAKQIEREVGTLLQTDRVLQGAVSPEVKLGLDSAVSALASVTDVELSNDLQVAKVYISIYSDPEGKDIAMRGLSKLEGYVRKHIAQTVNLRLCPEIRFIRDDSLQRGEEVLALLERIKRQDAGEIEPPAIAIGGFRGSGEEYVDDEDDDDDDMEIEDDLEEDEGFLDALDESEDVAEEGEDGDEDEDEGIALLPDRELDFMPDIDGAFAPTVREPWRSERELKRVKGRSKKGGRKTTSRRR